mgnify:CR=1 FL=1
MAVYEAAIKRRTIRRSKQTPISLEILKKIVNAGRLAASSANLQPIEFIIIEEVELIGRMIKASFMCRKEGSMMWFATINIRDDDYNYLILNQS